MDRGPGWPAVLGLTLVVITFAVVHPLQLMLVPMAMVLVALPPREPRLLLFAGLLLAVVFAGPRGALWSVERGWALLLGGWFIVTVLAWPSASFVARAVTATGATTATGAALIALFGRWGELDWAIASQYRELAGRLAESWPGGVSPAVVDLAATIQGRLFPAFLAVASVAALGVAWWTYGRLARHGNPLGRLTQFRFPDVLLWVLIAGIALLVIPVGGWSERLGSNLVFFMGALYALRGLAVVVALVLGLVGTQLPVLIALAVVGVLLYPIVVAGTLLLGVTDTWLDLRSGGVVNEDG
ncbi:MAG: DUF2232 domain-containing protein [Longimicrobiales bacterium]|nr:DUF2232 domain-containing protein [Longimicrobiales bacterium]